MYKKTPRLTSKAPFPFHYEHFHNMSCHYSTPEFVYLDHYLEHIGGGEHDPTVHSPIEAPNGLPFLDYPQRVLTPILVEQIAPIAIELAMEGAHIQEWQMQVAVHAALIAQVGMLLQGTLAQAIRAFAREPPAIPTIPRRGIVVEEDPLPIPPRIGTPHPNTMLPPYSPPQSESSYHVRSPSITPPPIPPPSTPSDIERPTAQPNEHPGYDWIPNGTEGDRLHDVEIPIGTGQQIQAPFIRYDFDTDSPELLAMLRRGCPVHSTFLHTRLTPYPLPVFTRKE
jgi:hypothetical protein